MFAFIKTLLEQSSKSNIRLKRNWPQSIRSSKFLVWGIHLDQGSQTQIGWRATLRVKMLRGPQFMRKKFMRAAKYKKGPQNKLNLIKLYTLVIFEVFEGRTNASGGPRVWDPWFRHFSPCLACCISKIIWSRRLAFEYDHTFLPIFVREALFHSNKPVYKS